MVKLVVADDEERVCRLIVALGNWKELGIKVLVLLQMESRHWNLFVKKKQIF